MVSLVHFLSSQKGPVHTGGKKCEDWPHTTLPRTRDMKLGL